MLADAAHASAQRPPPTATTTLRTLSTPFFTSLAADLISPSTALSTCVCAPSSSTASTASSNAEETPRQAPEHTQPLRAAQHKVSGFTESPAAARSSGWRQERGAVARRSGAGVAGLHAHGAAPHCHETSPSRPWQSPCPRSPAPRRSPCCLKRPCYGCSASAAAEKACQQRSRRNDGECTAVSALGGSEVCQQ